MQSEDGCSGAAMAYVSGRVARWQASRQSRWRGRRLDDVWQQADQAILVSRNVKSPLSPQPVRVANESAAPLLWLVRSTAGLSTGSLPTPFRARLTCASIHPAAVLGSYSAIASCRSLDIRVLHTYNFFCHDDYARLKIPFAHVGPVGEQPDLVDVSSFQVCASGSARY